MSADSFNKKNVDAESLICVEPDEELKEKGYDSEIVIDKKYIYKTSYLDVEELKEGEYDLLKRCAVPFSKTEEQRIEFLKKQLEKSNQEE